MKGDNQKKVELNATKIIKFIDNSMPLNLDINM